MKNNFLIVLLGIITFFTFVNCRLNAQTLSLIDLQNLCKKQSWENVDNYLSKKGWEYHDSKKGDFLQYSTITYAYDKNYWNDKAKAWLSVYAYNNEVHKIVFQCSSKTNYNSIKNSLASSGYKKTDSQILDQMISIVYENSIYKIEIASMQSLNDDFDTHYDSYSFVVIRKNGVYDSQNGPVTNYWFDGTSIMEEYTLKNGKYNGAYKFYSSDGKLKYQYNYVNGQKQGKGTYYFDDGSQREVNFVNDELSGVAKTFDENKILRCLEIFANDKKNGKYEEYNEKGIRTFEATMKDDSINGKYTLYFDDGISIKQTGNQIMGQKDGEIFYYDQDGNLLLTRIYSRDKKNGESIVYGYDQGKLYVKKIENYKNDLKHGKFSTILIDKDTTEIEFANYINDKKNGLAKENFDNYVLIANYKDDLLHGNVKIYMEEPFRISLFPKPIGIKNINDLWLKSEYNYTNGVKNGEFVEYFNYLNYTYLKQTGFYENGKKSSVWKTFQQPYTFTKSEPDELIYLQTYSNDMLNGESVSYLRYKSKGEKDSSDVYEKCEISVDFKNGRYNGEYLSKNQDGQLESKGIFINGQPSKYWIYNLTKNPMEYEFYFDKITLKLMNDDGETVLNTYTYNRSQWQEFNSNTFVETVDFSSENYEQMPILFDITQIQFLDSFVKEKNFGAYEVRDKSGNLKITGFWDDSKKYGIWKYYHRDQNIRIEKDESSPNTPTRYYYVDNNQPFTGEYVEGVEYQGSNYKAIYKIKNGLLEGKTKFNDPETEKTIFSFKYKEGKLEE